MTSLSIPEAEKLIFQPLNTTEKGKNDLTDIAFSACKGNVHKVAYTLEVIDCYLQYVKKENVSEFSNTECKVKEILLAAVLATKQIIANWDSEDLSSQESCVEEIEKFLKKKVGYKKGEENKLPFTFGFVAMPKHVNFRAHKLYS